MKVPYVEDLANHSSRLWQEIQRQAKNHPPDL